MSDGEMETDSRALRERYEVLAMDGERGRRRAAEIEEPESRMEAGSL